MDHLMDRYDFQIHTFGCKVNTYDSGLLERRFEALGHRKAEGKHARPRVHVLNTCAVTAEASKEAAKLLRRLKSREPLATVVVTGCGAQVDGAVFDNLKGADLVVANSHKGQLERILDQHFKGELTSRVFRSNIFRKEDLEAGGGIEGEHTRSFLKIQDGCNSFCTYCVIPFARGKSRSIPSSELVTRIRELSAQGAAEVVLTGVHIGDYESREGARALGLVDLVREVLEKTSIGRIRLSSLEPVELTSELLALYKQTDRLCPHFHMSIQSATTRVLKAMRRNYEAEHVESSLLAIKSEVPGAFVGMDVIVGFPGETDDEFAETYERLDRLPWTRIHVFPYSERPGTKAATYPDPVPRDQRALRSERLRQLSGDRYAMLGAAQIGLVKSGLLLRSRERGVEALARDYWPIALTNASDYVGQIGREVRVEITGFDASDAGRMVGKLEGRVVEGA